MRSSMSPMLHTNGRGRAAPRSSRARVLHLEPAGVVLLQDGQHAVVRVLADAPALGARGPARRVVEDAEQHERVPRVALGEVVAARARGASAMPRISAWPRPRHRVHPVEHRFAEARRAPGRGSGRAAACPPRRADRPAELGAEVEALLQVGPSRRSARRRPGTSRARRARRSAMRSRIFSASGCAKKRPREPLEPRLRAPRRRRGRRRRRSRARGTRRRAPRARRAVAAASPGARSGVTSRIGRPVVRRAAPRGSLGHRLLDHARAARDQVRPSRADPLGAALEVDHAALDPGRGDVEPARVVVRLAAAARPRR